MNEEGFFYQFLKKHYDEKTEKERIVYDVYKIKRLGQVVFNIRGAMLATSYKTVVNLLSDLLKWLNKESDLRLLKIKRPYVDNLELLLCYCLLKANIKMDLSKIASEGAGMFMVTAYFITINEKENDIISSLLDSLSSYIFFNQDMLDDGYQMLNELILDTPEFPRMEDLFHLHVHCELSEQDCEIIHGTHHHFEIELTANQKKKRRRRQLKKMPPKENELEVHINKIVSNIVGAEKCSLTKFRGNAANASKVNQDSNGTKGDKSQMESKSATVANKAAIAASKSATVVSKSAPNQGKLQGSSNVKKEEVNQGSKGTKDDKRQIGSKSVKSSTVVSQLVATMGEKQGTKTGDKDEIQYSPVTFTYLTKKESEKESELNCLIREQDLQIKQALQGRFGFKVEDKTIDDFENHEEDYDLIKQALNNRFGCDFKISKKTASKAKSSEKSEKLTLNKSKVVVDIPPVITAKNAKALDKMVEDKRKEEIRAKELELKKLKQENDLLTARIISINLWEPVERKTGTIKKTGSGICCELEQKTEEVRKLKQQNEKLCQELVAMKFDQKKQMEQVQNKTEEMNKLQEVVDKHTQDLMEWGIKKRSKSIKIQTDKISNDNKDLDQEASHKKKNAEIKKLKQELESLSTELNKKKTKTVSNQNEASQMGQKENKSTNNQEQEAQKKKNEEIKKLKHEIERLSKFPDAKKDVKSILVQTEEFSNDPNFKKFEDEQKKLKKDIEKLTHENKELNKKKTESVATTKELKKLQQNNNKLTLENKKLKTDIDQLAKEINRQQLAENALISENMKLNKDMTILTQKLYMMAPRDESQLVSVEIQTDNVEPIVQNVNSDQSIIFSLMEEIKENQFKLFSKEEIVNNLYLEIQQLRSTNSLNKAEETKLFCELLQSKTDECLNLRKELTDMKMEVRKTSELNQKYSIESQKVNAKFCDVLQKKDSEAVNLRNKIEQLKHDLKEKSDQSQEYYDVALNLFENIRHLQDKLLNKFDLKCTERVNFLLNVMNFSTEQTIPCRYECYQQLGVWESNFSRTKLVKQDFLTALSVIEGDVKKFVRLKEIAVVGLLDVMDDVFLTNTITQILHKGGRPIRPTDLRFSEPKTTISNMQNPFSPNDSPHLGKKGKVNSTVPDKEEGAACVEDFSAELGAEQDTGAEGDWTPISKRKASRIGRFSSSVDCFPGKNNQWIYDDNDDNCCTICFEPFGNVSSHTLTCKHQFHKQCINKWLNKNSQCPICRPFIVRDKDFPMFPRK